MSTSSPFLSVRDLTVRFEVGTRRRRSTVDAVRNVSFELHRGETFGLVGESGSGKTTVSRTIIGLVRPSGGEIRLDGQRIDAAMGAALRAVRRRIQMVYQDPYSSLNPRLTVRELVEEPVKVHTTLSSAERARRVASLLDQVQLASFHAGRRPSQLSGGQRQRVAIGRALAVEPEILLCDEPVSALDVSTQAQIINLLEQLQRELGLTFLFVSHDLSVVEHISDRIGVMYRGDLVESGDAGRLNRTPRHPYTANLLAAVPSVDIDRQAAARRARRQLTVRAAGDVIPATGCRFAPRCSFAIAACSTDAPDRTPTTDGMVMCHRFDELDLGNHLDIEQADAHTPRPRTAAL